MVRDEECGLLVPPGDVDALRVAIQRLLADPGLRDRLGWAASRRAAAFGAGAVVPVYEQVYRALTPVRPAQAGRTPQLGDTAAAAEAAPDV